MMKSLFGQFSPDFVTFMPLQMISCILAIIWMMFMFPTKFFSGQMTYMWIMMRLEMMKLLFQKSKKKSAPWILLITSMFFLMLSMKMMGLLPYAFTMTSHVSFTYSMAMPLWLSMKMLGFYLAFNKRLSHLVPQGTPTFLIPLMVWMESLSLLAQPMALGLRLAAKLTAGHLLMFLLSTATWILMSSPIMSSLIMIILILLFLLEMGVACMQAYVFTSLVKFYLDQNM